MAIAKIDGILKFTKLGHLSCLELLKSQQLNFHAQLLKFYYVKVL